MGLAANQVGVLQRVFVFDLEGEGTKAVVNPRLVNPSDDKETEEEGCLSLEGVRVPVQRSQRSLWRVSTRAEPRSGSSSRD